MHFAQQHPIRTRIRIDPEYPRRLRRTHEGVRAVIELLTAEMGYLLRPLQQETSRLKLGACL
jgi:hypothetical protein